MKARSTAIQGALALVGLAAAYFTWQRPAETVRADSVTVFNASKQSLERVWYTDGTRFLEVDRHTSPEPRLWVTLGFLPGKTPVFDAGTPNSGDAGVDAGVPAPPPEPPPTRQLFANERAAAVFGRFMPFEATRALGKLEPAKLDELGLAGTERRLEVTVAGQIHRFLVSRPQPGIVGSYLLEEPSKEVFLVPANLFSELDPASQVLVERRLHAFRQPEFDAFTLSVGGKEASFVQTGADVPQTAKVARKETPGTADELAKNWHDKVWNRLVVTEVLGQGELPKGGAPALGLRLEYFQGGDRKGWLELGLDAQKRAWARSENTASWVAVHQGAEELLAEAKKLAP